MQNAKIKFTNVSIFLSLIIALCQVSALLTASYAASTNLQSAAIPMHETLHQHKVSPFRPDAYSIATGYGNPNDLVGGRVAAQWDWDKHWLSDHMFEIRGYWDASVAYWQTDGDEIEHRHKALAVVALAPIFRLQGTEQLSTRFSPYLQASVGLSVISHHRLGRRDLGRNWQFQDLLGGGLQFGENLKWDLGVHYLHYSNAKINPPNHGIDVKVLAMLTVHAVG